MDKNRGRIRFFGSRDCQDCLFTLRALKTVFDGFKPVLSVDIEYIDADADETQELCDLEEVDRLPHIQFFDKNSMKVKEIIGKIDEKSLGIALHSLYNI